MKGYFIFGQSDIGEKLNKLSPVEFNLIPFGAILLDNNGLILKFNNYEANIIRRTPAELVGKNFFQDIAPCFQNTEFYDKFLLATKNSNVNILFEYNINNKDYDLKLKIHLLNDQEDSNKIWLLIKRL